MSWKKLGYSIKTFNSSYEKSILLNEGFNEDDIVEIHSNETAKGFFNKGIPRILPLLNRAMNLDYDAYVLTNADIFPSHRKVVSPFLASLNSSIALTRNECVSIANNKPGDSFPYRGGLDTFFFTREGLTNIFQQLLKKDVSERMTFGIPGWDYYLGHIILESGGMFMDGEVLLHQSHQTTYSQVDEFNFYAEVMYASEFISQSDTGALVSFFANKIDVECAANQKISTLFKRMFYARPTIPEIALYSDDIDEVLTEIKKEIEFNDFDLKVTIGLRAFIQDQLESISCFNAEEFRKSLMNHVSIIESSFILLSIQLIIKKMKNKLNLSVQYPKGSLHGAALRQIIENTQGAERLKYLINLFTSELVEHNIFNHQLYKYLVLSAYSQRQLASCKLISSICSKG
jgi:hypothetical protein